LQQPRNLLALSRGILNRFDFESLENDKYHIAIWRLGSQHGQKSLEDHFKHHRAPQLPQQADKVATLEYNFTLKVLCPTLAFFFIEGNDSIGEKIRQSLVVGRVRDLQELTQ
jgi:hypothetical protein